MCLGQLSVIEMLIQNGANVNAVNKHDATALIFAADNGKLIKIVQQNSPISGKYNKQNQNYALHLFTHRKWTYCGTAIEKWGECQCKKLVWWNGIVVGQEKRFLFFKLFDYWKWSNWNQWTASQDIKIL